MVLQVIGSWTGTVLHVWPKYVQWHGCESRLPRWSSGEWWSSGLPLNVQVQSHAFVQNGKMGLKMPKKTWHTMTNIDQPAIFHSFFPIFSWAPSRAQGSHPTPTMSKWHTRLSSSSMSSSSEQSNVLSWTEIWLYPLVNIQKNYGKSPFLRGKSTISYDFYGHFQ